MFRKEDDYHKNIIAAFLQEKEKSILEGCFDLVSIMTGVSNEDQSGVHETNSQLADISISAPMFHPRCGQLVTLSQQSRTASRTHATQVRLDNFLII